MEIYKSEDVPKKMVMKSTLPHHERRDICRWVLASPLQRGPYHPENGLDLTNNATVVLSALSGKRAKYFVHGHLSLAESSDRNDISGHFQREDGLEW